MGTGYTRNDTANNIADGNVINAADLDGEFDAIQAAFNATTGHSHDGTTGEGPQIGTGGIADLAVTTGKIANDAVTLGTKTSGNYVAAGAVSGVGLSGSASAEGATFTVTSNATNANTASTIVARDASGNFSAGTITASLSGNATTATTASGVTANSVALGTDTTGNYVGTITGGTGIDSTGATSGEGVAHTLNLDLNELPTSTTNTDGDYFVVVDSADGSQHKLTKANIALSGMNNDAGWTSNVGDITGVTAGTNLTGGGTSGTVTINMATGGAGAGTYGSTSNATKIDTITLDAYGRVTAVATGDVGDIQGVTAGTGLTGGGTSGTVTVSHSDTSTLSGNYGQTGNTGGTVTQDILLGVDGFGHVTSLTSTSTNLDTRYIQGVTAGNGLTGGGTSGTVTLNVGAGTGVTVAADTISIGQAVGTGNSVTFAGVNINGNLNAVDNIYLARYLYHEGDTDTYIDFVAANEMRIVTGASENMRFRQNYIQAYENVVGSVETASKTGSVTPDLQNYNSFVWTLTGNITLNNPSTEIAGMSGVFIFIHSGAARTVSLGTDWETAGGAGLTLSSASGAVDIVPYYVQASGNILLGTPQLAFA